MNTKIKYAISPIGAHNIRKGKKYIISRENAYDFYISVEQLKNSNGTNDAFCLKKGCNHIKGKDWKIIES